jgi:hypothetical protein
MNQLAKPQPTQIVSQSLAFTLQRIPLLFQPRQIALEMRPGIGDAHRIHLQIIPIQPQPTFQQQHIDTTHNVHS